MAMTKRTHMPDTADCIALDDALRTLALMGDLSMGQPIDHSPRVAALAAALARHQGMGPKFETEARQTALLRWSGCTANATDMAATISDDVQGRAAMLALQFDQIELLVSPQKLGQRVLLTSTIHCEVSSLIARTLGLDANVALALGCVFEHWDGSGAPAALRGAAIPPLALWVSVCSEFEILQRVHGLEAALTLLQQRANHIYPAALVQSLSTHARAWLAELDVRTPSAPARPIQLSLIGQVIDLKLPWLSGHSQAVVNLADRVAHSLNLPAPGRALLRRAAWLHGLGRVAVPNAVWSREAALSAADWERVRLAPYWTSRAVAVVGALSAEAELASAVYERLDGSGYFRGLHAVNAPMEQRILALAVAWVAMRSHRPWRQALTIDAALLDLQAEASKGRLDSQVLGALAGVVAPHAPWVPDAPERQRASYKTQAQLTARELEVLRRISLGDSNKAAAQHLGISPATVRTHLENIFKKLNCKTRAACILQASLLGWLDGTQPDR